MTGAATKDGVLRVARARTRVAGIPVSKVDERTDRQVLPFVGLAALLSTVVFALAGRALSAPWIVPDELIYSELAKSLADGSLPSVRGEATLSYGLVYPAIIAPAWAIFDDPANAYVAAKIINAVVMSLAAFPAYFLARRFVTVTSAALVATFSVFIPSMLLSGTLLIEPVLYPIFLLALLGIVAALQDPTRRNQLLAVSAIGLACLTKPLSVVLAPAYVVALVHLGILDRQSGGGVRKRLRTHSAALAVLGVFGALAVLGPGLRGDPSAVLGVYGVVLGNIDLSGTLVWFVRHLAGLDLYVAVVPFAATLVLIALTFLRRGDTRMNEFAAVTLWTVGGTLAAVAAYASKPLAGATGYIPTEARLHERNMFVLVPLLLIGLALFLERRRAERRGVLITALGLAVVLPFFLPLDELLWNANFQALVVIPWTAGDLTRFWPLTFLPLAVLSALAFLSPRSRAYTWGVVGFMFVVTTISAHASMSHPNSGASSTLGIGYDTRWVDHSVPAHADVLAFSVASKRQDDLGLQSRTIWLTEFFNRSVGRVVEVGRPMLYDLPHQDAVIEGGLLRDVTGTPISSRYVLAPCSVTILGQVVASDRRVHALVYRTDGQRVRVTEAPSADRRCDGSSDATTP